MQLRFSEAYPTMTTEQARNAVLAGTAVTSENPDPETER